MVSFVAIETRLCHYPRMTYDADESLCQLQLQETGVDEDVERRRRSVGWLLRECLGSFLGLCLSPSHAERRQCRRKTQPSRFLMPVPLVSLLRVLVSCFPFVGEVNEMRVLVMCHSAPAEHGGLQDVRSGRCEWGRSRQLHESPPYCHSKFAHFESGPTNTADLISTSRRSAGELDLELRGNSPSPYLASGFCL